MSELVAIDFETHPILDSVRLPRPVCLSVAVGTSVELYDAVSAEAVLSYILRQDEITIVGHNIAFDLGVVVAHYPALRGAVWKAYDDGRVRCTLIRERLKDLALGESNRERGYYSLASLTARYLQVILDKDDAVRLTYGDFENIPIETWPDRMKNYAKADAMATLQCYSKQDGLWPTEHLEARADFALKLMSAWGLATDPRRVETALAEARKSILAFGKKLVAAGLAHEDRRKQAVLRDVKALRARVERALPNPPRTEQGNTKTDAETLRLCTDDPDLMDVVSYNEQVKTLSTYLDKLGRPSVHCEYRVLGAETSRTSCSEPNLQNQPRKGGIRECFVPRPGHLLLACDYDSQEMRCLAQVCLDIVGWSTLAERYKADPHFDPHLEFAAALLGISVDEAKRRKAEKDPVIKENRQHAKAANFGFPGGMGASTFVAFARGYDIDLSLERAEELKSAWLQQWKEMRIYFQFVARFGNDPTATQVHRSGFTRRNLTYCQAANGYFQTLAAHASKTALWRVSRACYDDPNSVLYCSRPVVFVHDELILEVPDFAGHEAALELERLMVESMQVWTPDVPVTASAALMRRWSKSAEPTRNQEGRLIPWEDAQ